MNRALLIVICGILLVGCNAAQEEAIPSVASDKDDNPSETVEPRKKEIDDEKEASLPLFHLATPEGIPPLETTSLSSPFGDDGNIKFQNTEIEIVDEFMDEDGRIYFDLDDHPIRHITREGGANYIANYYDALIHIKDAKAYDLSEQEQIEQVYHFFISNPPEELVGKDPSEYRSWEEATNLERGMMAATDLLRPYLNHVGALIEDDIYNGEQFEQVMKEFELIGSPLTLIPAPQTVYDMQLYENISMVQSLWRELADFENPEDNKDEFIALYNQIREEMNHMVVRINFTLSEK